MKNVSKLIVRNVVKKIGEGNNKQSEVMCECKWKQHWVNQGLVGCEKNRPELRFGECESGCPLREIVETLASISSSASTYSPSRPVPHASPIYIPGKRRRKNKAKQ